MPNVNELIKETEERKEILALIMHQFPDSGGIFEWAEHFEKERRFVLDESNAAAVAWLIVRALGRRSVHERLDRLEGLLARTLAVLDKNDHQMDPAIRELAVAIRQAIGN